jgi:hypothetical protein
MIALFGAPRTGPHYLDLGPTPTYPRRRAGWFPVEPADRSGRGENRLGTLRLVLDRARCSTDTTEIDEYAVQEELDLDLPRGVRSFLLENETEPDEFGPFRCVIGGHVNWCGCEAGWFDQRRYQPTGCKHRDALAPLVEAGVLGNFENLMSALTAAVELRILELGRAGGPTDADTDRARERVRPVASSSDVMTFGTRREPGTAAEIVAAIADGLAVLAFCPGGVTFAGRRWAVGKHNRKAG